MERFRNEDRIVQLTCKMTHIFHRDCLEKWVIQHNETKCPYCKRDIE